jgi:hypothetical protein
MCKEAEVLGTGEFTIKEQLDALPEGVTLAGRR